jgi:hypothetical protein
MYRDATTKGGMYSEGMGFGGAEYVCVLELIYVYYANLNY